MEYKTVNYMQPMDAMLKTLFLYILWGPRELPRPGFEGMITH